MNDFQSLTYNFYEKYIISDENADPDVNFFSDMYTDSLYHYPSTIKEFLFKNVNDINSENIRILHIIIRSLSKNNENFRHFLEETENIFNIKCVTETWRSTFELFCFFD